MHLSQRGVTILETVVVIVLAIVVIAGGGLAMIKGQQRSRASTVASNLNLIRLGLEELRSVRVMSAPYTMPVAATSTPIADIGILQPYVRQDDLRTEYEYQCAPGSNTLIVTTPKFPSSAEALHALKWLDGTCSPASIHPGDDRKINCVLLKDRTKC